MQKGRTVTAVDLLLVERFRKVDGEGVGTAVAATVPCLCHGWRGPGFRSHIN